MINEDVTARTYQELARLETVLNDLGVDTKLIKRSEEYELNTLVALLEQDEQGRDRFANLTFMPLPENEIEFIDMIQIYTSYPFQPVDAARGQTLELINGLNPRLPFGCMGINNEGQVYYRYILSKRRHELVDADSVGEQFLLFQFAAAMFAQGIEVVAMGDMKAQEILEQL